MRWRSLLVVMLLVGLAACGGSDDATSTSATDAEANPTAPAESTPTPTVPAPEPSEPALRDELLEMLAADQAERTLDDPGATYSPSNDAARTARLKEIIDEHGWPTWDLVGVDGATAAWAIAQHSDQDVAFQKGALTLLEAAAADGNSSPGEVAYLTDRVAVNSGEPQVYGTQLRGCVDGKPAPAPMIDEDQVDERRAEVGLGTLEEYFAEFEDFGC
jgi:hypothetical protein